MSKIGNKDLATALTAKHGLSKPDADKFVAKMFEVLGKGLNDDKIVKVKGLGTFKVISVAPRKSVDVNTGEPIVIEGRDKISFTPDATLRDEVNKPFSQFETVVVNDGVDFSEIDDKFSNKEETPYDEEQDYSPTVAEEQSIATAVDENQSKTMSSAEGNSQAEEYKDEYKEEREFAKVEPNHEEDIEPVYEEETGAGHEEMTEPVYEEKEEQGALQTTTYGNDELLHEVRHQHRTLKYVLIAACFIIIVCLAGVFYMFTQIQQRDRRIENLEAQVMAKASLSKPKAKTRYASASSPKNDVASLTKEITTAGADNQPKEAAITEADNINEVPTKVKTTETTTKANIQKSAYNVNSEYDKDPRIRTGAYNIVGISETTIVKAGQTLSSISRFYLGPGMECYVEAVNNGQTEFKAGEKIKIPKLQLKKKNKANP